MDWWVAATHPIITMGLLTGTVQNWLAVQNVIRILVTIYIQNASPAGGREMNRPKYCSFIREFYFYNMCTF